MKLTLLILALIAGCNQPPQERSHAPVSFWPDGAAPFSSDPMDFDEAIHHAIFSSAYSVIVNEFEAGGRPKGAVAKTWTRSPDYKEWTFVLRNDLYFSNGDPITAQDVVDSWERVIRLRKQKGSQPGALGNLIGYDHFPRPDKRIVGITHSDRAITLRFSKPVPDLLDILSFGLYSVVHGTCFDHQTGRWLDPKRVIASGPYRVSEWNDKHVLLTLRNDFPKTFFHPHPISAFEVVWDSASHATADIVIAPAQNNIGKQGYLFYGGAARDIYYMRALSWQDPRSPLFNVRVRRALRDHFFAEFAREGMHPARSFFPLALSGIHEMPPQPPPIDLRLPPGTPSILRFARLGPNTEFAKKTDAALNRAAAALGLSWKVVETSGEQVHREQGPKLSHYQEDMVPLGTSIDITSPDDDIRFMLLTADGIRLPDPTGNARRAARRNPIDRQAINKILWDDAIVWPFRHLSTGRWAKSDLDFSRVNRDAMETPLHLIGWNL